jgi:cyclic beta-1,2-glucan synthetase
LLSSELFSADQLRLYALALAASHRVDRRPGADRLLPRLAENETALVTAS